MEVAEMHPAHGDDPRASSDAAGTARGSPRLRTELLSSAGETDAPKPAPGGAPGDAENDGAHMQAGRAESARLPELPAVCTEAEALAHFGALVDHVCGALGLQGLLGAREAVETALSKARWDAAAVIAEAAADPVAWRALHGIAWAPPAGPRAPLSCALCRDELGPDAALLAVRLSCGHVLCADNCARSTAGHQSELRPCLPLGCLVPRTCVVCPFGDCNGFMPRATANACLPDEARASMAEPLRLAPLARSQYLRCVACPLLLHRRRGTGDAEAAGLRCRCGARTCVLRGGVEECAGRAHPALSCAAARGFEAVHAAFRPLFDAARVQGEAARAEAQARLALQALEPEVDEATDDSDGDGEEDDLMMDVMRMYMRMRQGLDRPGLGERRAAQRSSGLNAVAAKVLCGGGAVDDGSDAFLAAVPTEREAVLQAADAACLPLLRGPELRLRHLIRSDAPSAAAKALERAHAAVNAAETAVEVAHGAVLRRQVGVTESAARAAAAAATEAENAAASARASATAAAAAAERLGATDAEAAAGAAAVATSADEAAELLNVVRGHACTAFDLIRDAKAAALVAPTVAAGPEALSESYLNENTRPCPNCGIACTKGSGQCNWMEPCKLCKRSFCWSCLGPGHEHSYGPCSRASDRAAVEAAIAAARPEANPKAHAAAMAITDADVRVSRGGVNPPPRPARLADAERVPEDEAELVILALAAVALRSAATAGEDAVAAVQLRVVRALLAQIARTADAAKTAAEPDGERRGLTRLQRMRERDDEIRRERDAERQQEARRQRRLQRQQATRDAAQRALHAALDADAPVRAAAERAATALAKLYDDLPHATFPRTVRDFPAAADAWVRMHAARCREAAAKAAAAAPPLGVQRVTEAEAAWRAGALALAAAEAAVAAALVMQLFDALRLPTVYGDAPLMLLGVGSPDQELVRDAAAALEQHLRAVGAACGLDDLCWPPTPEQAQLAGDDERTQYLPAAVALLKSGAATLLELADGMAVPW